MCGSRCSLAIGGWCSGWRVPSRVAVQGNVWRPGTYHLAREMRLSALIRAAGGLKPDTYLERAFV